MLCAFMHMFRVSTNHSRDRQPHVNHGQLHTFYIMRAATVAAAAAAAAAIPPQTRKIDTSPARPHRRRGRCAQRNADINNVILDSNCSLVAARRRAIILLLVGAHAHGLACVRSTYVRACYAHARAPINVSERERAQESFVYGVHALESRVCVCLCVQAERRRHDISS